MARPSGKTKGPKTLSKKVKKPPVHRKRPGFDAFMTSAKGKKGSRVACKEVAAPETGIHSRGWASMIAPNKSGLFKLSVELRLRIWEDVIDAINVPELFPSKAGDKFVSLKDSNTRYLFHAWDRYKQSVGTIMIGLYTLCRQAYVDIYGSALLYRIKPFHFSSPERMLNYLAVINPLHRNSINTITLDCKLYKGKTRQFALEPTWPMLQSMESLRSLEIVFIPHDRLTQYNMSTPHVTVKPLCFAELIEKLKKHEGLKGIRGLKNFKLRVELCFPEQKLVVHDVCEDIKKVVLLEKPTPMVDEGKPHDTDVVTG